MKYKLIENSLNDINRLIKTVLNNRGITNIEEFMSSNKEDLEQNSYKDLDNIEKGVKTLLTHIKNRDNIALVVDPDVDGMTSAALFINYTYKLFPAYVQNNITYLCHTGKQHGLNDMMEYIPEDTKFLVMIDSSSNDYEYHQQLAERGIDILILDHHEADKVSKYACVINNQLCNII